MYVRNLERNLRLQFSFQMNSNIHIHLSRVVVCLCVRTPFPLPCVCVFVSQKKAKVSLAFITANVIIGNLNTHLNFARYTALKDLDIPWEQKIKANHFNIGIVKNCSL